MIDRNKALSAYYSLIKVRFTEEAIAERYKEQEMRCPVHLSIGQEAVAVGVAQCLEKEDVIFSTHRCHSHYLAKGGDLEDMIHELYGRKTGCAKGLGGSMHLIDDRVGMLGSSAIVGGSIPLAVGAALTIKMQNSPHVAAAFFGDGAAEEGVFYESMNFSALHKLPVIFVCENNFLATSSNLSSRKPLDNVSEHGMPFGIPGESVNGNDFFAVKDLAQKAVGLARQGKGPSLIEARTLRKKKHVGPEGGQFYADEKGGSTVPKDLSEADCPIRNFEERVLLENILSQADLDSLKKEVQTEIDNAFNNAQNAEIAEWI